MVGCGPSAGHVGAPGLGFALAGQRSMASGPTPGSTSSTPFNTLASGLMMIGEGILIVSGAFTAVNSHFVRIIPDWLLRYW